MFWRQIKLLNAMFLVYILCKVKSRDDDLYKENYISFDLCHDSHKGVNFMFIGAAWNIF